MLLLMCFAWLTNCYYYIYCIAKVFIFLHYEFCVTCIDWYSIMFKMQLIIIFWWLIVCHMSVSFEIITERLFWFLLFKSYDSVTPTIGCKLGIFYHEYLLFYY